MRPRIERSALPDPGSLKRLVSERADGVMEGARVVDAEAQGFTGFDLILADALGRPIFVDIVCDAACEVPSRAFEHLDWLERNRRLFLKAYSREGVVRAEEPIFVFIAPAFPPGTVRAVASLEGVAIRLVRAEYVTVDGTGELLLESVELPEHRRQASVLAVTPTRPLQSASSLDCQIESEPVRRLLGLFRSGVDGLDGRISEREGNGGTVFELAGRPLAHVTVSPVSFTVSPGDRAANPIVVSDRVSLERALNAVVSLFVREGRPSDGDAGARGGGAAAGEEEGTELAGIWGAGVARSAR